jgi:single-strand DNA-binding protein
MPDLKMPELNAVTISGRLTGDPALAYTHGGTAVLDLRIAATRHSKQGEETGFYDVTVWAEAAERYAQELRKGAPVIIEGRLTVDTWNDKDTGKSRSKVKITANRVSALQWPDKADSGATAPQERRPEPEPPTTPKHADLPF